MKKVAMFILALALLGGNAARSQSKADSLAIEKACRDFVEGWATGDAERVAGAVSPELVKRAVGLPAKTKR